MSLAGINSSYDHILLLVNAQDLTFVKRWKVAHMVKSCEILSWKHLEDKTHVIPDISLRVHTRQQSMEFPATTSLLRFFTKKRLWSFRQYQKYKWNWIISPGKGENKKYLKPPTSMDPSIVCIPSMHLKRSLHWCWMYSPSRTSAASGHAREMLF